jgi:NTE family protein
MKAQKVFSALTAVALNVAMAGQVYAETASTDAVVETSQTRTETTSTKTKNATSTTTTTTTEKPATGAKRPRIGLALGGGGSRGSAHVGVLKVLLEEGVPIDMIAGTSIGSVVGGFYAAGVPVDELEAQFQNDTFIKEFMPWPLMVRLALEPIIFTPRLVGYHPYDGLYKGGKFRKYAERLSGHTSIESLNMPFAAVVTNVVTGATCRITAGDLGTALQASTAVPGLKKPVQIGEQLYCDGGLVCNVPTRHVREMGADFIIAVNIDEFLPEVPLKTFRKAGSMSTQALKIQLATEDDTSCKAADVFLHPDTTGITLISRKKSDAQRGIEAGIKAAREAMPEIKRKLLAVGIVLKPVNPKVSTTSTDAK